MQANNLTPFFSFFFFFLLSIPALKSKNVALGPDIVDQNLRNASINDHGANT